MKTFGNTNLKCQNVDIVPLDIVTSNKVITIETICTPVICEPLSNQNVRKVSNNYNHLKNLKPADSSNKEIKDRNPHWIRLLLPNSYRRNNVSYRCSKQRVY